MARIAGVNIPDNKRIVIALTYIFGVGRSTARKVLKLAKVSQNRKTKEITEDELLRIKDAINKLCEIEGELKRNIMLNIKRLKDIGTYRGVRHAKHLPVRGQRTKTNSRTVRGNVRKTAGSGRKPSAEKT